MIADALRYYFNSWFFLDATPILSTLPIWIVGVVLSVRFRKQKLQNFTIILTTFIIFLTESIMHLFAIVLIRVSVTAAIITSDQHALYLDMVNWTSIFIRSVAWIILLWVFFKQKFFEATLD